MSDQDARLGLNPIVRARLDERFDAETHLARYASLGTDYLLVDDIAEAELALYPFVFHDRDRARVDEFVSQAESRQLRTVLFAGGDLEPVMQSASIVLLHPGPTRGAQPLADVVALPFFFTDRASGDVARQDGDRPTVAFCGQGAERPTARAFQAVARAAQNMEHRLRPRVVPPPLRGHVGLRSRAIEQLRRHAGVEEHFVIRDAYRAGATSGEERARTQREFDDNLRTSTYALCVRGVGNFSARFSEALSFGRVPLFVNTNCVLPLEDFIDWRSRTVSVEADQVDVIGDRLVEAHDDVLHDSLRSPAALRELWESHLTADGFFRHLPAKLRALI